MSFRKLFVVAVALMLLPVSLLAQTKPKYLILLIGDGMGPNVVKLYRGQMQKTSFDRFGEPVPTGTNNVFGKTTDSAASGTALACGIKTYNRAIGVDKEKVPVTSLAKILKSRGMRVGIVSSVGINDATPAAHYANRHYRQETTGIIADLVASDFDFFGISTFKYPKEVSHQELYNFFKRYKYNVAVKKGLEQLKPGNKNIFIARTTTYATEASLADVTSKALELLKNPDGFFLMVEGGAIDGSNHSNCSVGMMNEMIEFDKTIARVLDFAAKHPEETLVVVTADHDTGGLQLDGKVPVGFWKKSSHTYNTINRALQKMRAAKASKEQMIDFACKAAGIEVPVSGKAAEVINAAADRFVDGKQTEKGSMYGKYNPLVVAVLHARDAQNNFHYTTFSHTPAKVPTFALGNGSRLFVAPMENSDIPRRISIAATGVDLLEQYNGVQPFPPAAKNDFHFTVQSVTENSIVCRYNLGAEKSIKITLSGNGRNVVREMKEPWGRVTFDKLSPDTEYTVSCEKNSIKVRTLPALADVSVTGAVIADPHCSTAPDNPLQRMHSRSEELLNDAAKAVKEAKIDVLLVPGDITDKSRPAEFKIFMDAFKKAPYKILATPGNHDKLTRENSSSYKRVFKNPAGYCDINGIQFVTLNTWNGKLDNPGNANAIEKLDVSRPAIIQSHYQIKKSNNTIVDNNSAIKDSNKPAVRKMLDKIANSHSLILVGHKNAAEKVVIGKNALQINCPQLTQYPCGYLTFKANKDGIAISYKPAASVAVEERSRRLAPFENREKLALPCWNNFFKWHK